MVLTLGVDLLVGVVGGLVGYFAYVSIAGRSVVGLFFSPPVQDETDGESVRARISGPASFVNSQKAARWIAKIPESCRSVSVDFREATIVDYNFLALVEAELKKKNGLNFTFEGLDESKRCAVSPHPLATRFPPRGNRRRVS